MSLLLELKPFYVIGVGGYASGPFVLMASLMGFRTGLWEANAHPGMANRLLSRFVNHCFLVFEEAKNYLNHKNPVVTGMPLRQEIDAAADQVNTRDHQKKYYQKGDRPLRILSFGGSQGARAINYALTDMLMNHPELKGQIEVVHQVGSLDYKDMLERYKKISVDAKIHEFIFNMSEYYDWADLLICRGGASTIAEASAFGVPPIVIPLPLADSHQQKNAESLVAKNAGFMLIQKNMTPEVLFEEVRKVLDGKVNLEQMSQNLKASYVPHGTSEIVKEILK